VQGGVNLYRFVGNSPLGVVDPFGLTGFGPGFIGPLRPGDVRGPYLPDPSKKPPGWSPDWPTYDDDPRGPYSQDPKSGTKYWPHDDDPSHWPHYDDDKGGRYPPNSNKPQPNRRRPPSPEQSPTDPWPQPPPPPPASSPINFTPPKPQWWWILPFLLPWPGNPVWFGI
jgi:hypothetical protein